MSGSTVRGHVIPAAMILAATFSATAALAQQPTGTWSMAAALPQGRDEVQAAAVDGKIYLVGGAWAETKDGKRVEHYTEGFMSEYDPKADRWRERTRDRRLHKRYSRLQRRAEGESSSRRS